MNKVAIVIPARLASTRFPNKMLQEVIPGVTLIEHVYNQCCEIHNPSDVYVATDSFEIAELFLSCVVMTEECENGTERVAEASFVLEDYTHFVNVQGDMIDVPKHVVADIIDIFEHNHYDFDVVTVVKEMNEEDRNNPSTVKCINNGYKAKWFCRAPLAYGDWHLGIYGYTREALKDYYEVLNTTTEEHFESLEQLRWLQNDYNIDVVWTDEAASEINTPEDLDKWQLTRQS